MSQSVPQVKFSFRPVPFAICVAVLFLMLLSPVPQGLTPGAWHMLAIFVTVILAIITKVSSVGVLSIVGITLVALFRATAPTQFADGVPLPVGAGDVVKVVLSSYSNPLIWLIVVSVMIARGIIKTRLGERIGYYFISIWGKRTLGIGYSLALSELILAPFTPSNTARGGAIVHPIMKSIARAFGSDPEQKTQAKAGSYLALVNYHANPITSAMFITATAPNPLVVDFIAKATGGDFHLSWGTWALAMLLPGLVALLLMPLVIYLVAPPEIKGNPDAKNFAKKQLDELGPISRAEWVMGGIFLTMLLMWADVPAKILGPAFQFNATTTALFGLTLVLVTGILTWDEVLGQKSAWDTLIWFGALIMMADQLNKHGVIHWFSENVQQWMLAAGLSHFWVIALLVLIFLYSHYFFASTTAHISAMMLAFLTVGINLGVPAVPFCLMMAAASAIMMTLTHYATGTSPVIFGSGYNSLGQWWKVGFVMSVVNLAVWATVGIVWWKILGLF